MQTGFRSDGPDGQTQGYVPPTALRIQGPKGQKNVPASGKAAQIGPGTVDRPNSVPEVGAQVREWLPHPQSRELERPPGATTKSESPAEGYLPRVPNSTVQPITGRKRAIRVQQVLTSLQYPRVFKPLTSSLLCRERAIRPGSLRLRSEWPCCRRAGERSAGRGSGQCRNRSFSWCKTE